MARRKRAIVGFKNSRLWISKKETYITIKTIMAHQNIGRNPFDPFATHQRPMFDDGMLRLNRPARFDTARRMSNEEIMGWMTAITAFTLLAVGVLSGEAGRVLNSGGNPYRSPNPFSGSDFG